jgi:hypothetical protein
MKSRYLKSTDLWKRFLDLNSAKAGLIEADGNESVTIFKDGEEDEGGKFDELICKQPGGCDQEVSSKSKWKRFNSPGQDAQCQYACNKFNGGRAYDEKQVVVYAVGGTHRYDGGLQNCRQR